MKSPVPLFGLGNYSRSRPVNYQRRINLYSEISNDSERGSKITLYTPPGLTGFTNYGANPNRGVWSNGDSKYYVNRDVLWKEANDGTRTNVGTLLTTGGYVGMRDNGTQMMIVDGTYGYIFTFATDTLVQITDPGFPANPTSVAYLNLRFGVTSEGTGQYQWSAINDGLSWDALDFATEESNPDNLVRIWDENGQFILFGPETTGFAGATQNADAAFGAIGASAIEFGLAARWSVCKFDDSVIFLSKNRLGGVQVSTLSGYTRQTVSTADIETIFSAYSGVENATAFSYREFGHSFYEISFPSENVTWCFDGKSGEWHEIESSGGRHRAQFHVNHQNVNYVTDYEDGNTYILDPDALTDNGATIRRLWTGRHLFSGNDSRMAELWIDTESGVGLTTGQGTDPQLTMRVSKDGGRTWGAARWASFGALGAYKTRAIYRRLGRTGPVGDWLFEFTVTDPVNVTFASAWARLA